MSKYLLFLLLISNLIAKPELNEPKILQDYEIPYKFKNTNQEKYDVLSLDNYLRTLYLESKNNLDYKEKSDYLANSINRDKYNFNVYIDGYLRTGKKISDDVTNSVVYSEKGVAFHIDKLLFDREYFLTSKYNILYQRLANINKINKKNAIIIAGISTYMNLYFAKQNLKILKKMLKSQQIVFDNVKKGVQKGKLSKLDFIVAKSDLLKLKNSIILAQEIYLKNDYILRQSINSHSKKPFILQPVDVNLNISSIYEVQKKIIVNNADIAASSNLLKIKKLELLSAKTRFFPQLSYYSYIGYASSIDKTFSYKSNLNSQNWEVGLTLLIPLYNRNDITLKTQKAKYDILLQQNALIEKQKTNLIKATNMFHSIKSLKSQIEIAKTQFELSQEKLNIYKKQLLVGIIPYDKYSIVLNQYLTNLKNLQNLKQKKVINVVLLNILLGTKIVE